MRAKSFQSCLTLCDPIDCSLTVSSVHGILQTRILEWIAIPSSKGSSRSRDRTHVSCVFCIGRQIFYHCTTWEAQNDIESQSKQKYVNIFLLSCSFFLLFLLSRSCCPSNTNHNCSSHSPAPSTSTRFLTLSRSVFKKYESLFLFPLKVWLISCLHRSFYLHRPIEAGREWDQGPKLDSDCTVLTFPGR